MKRRIIKKIIIMITWSLSLEMRTKLQGTENLCVSGRTNEAREEVGHRSAPASKNCGYAAKIQFLIVYFQNRKAENSISKMLVELMRGCLLSQRCRSVAVL